MSGSLVRPTVRGALALVVVVLLARTSGAGVIAVKPRSAVAALDPSEHDVQLTMQARRALALDPELAPFKLGVRVTNRVATLWGPVPSAELGFRAEVCLRGLVELLAVHNHLWVSGEPAPQRPATLPHPPAFLPPPPAPALPGLPTEIETPPLAPAVERVVPVPLTPDPAELPPARLPQPK